jgi:hypothetical protein
LPNKYKISFKDRNARNILAFEEARDGRAIGISARVKRDVGLEVTDVCDPQYRKALRRRTDGAEDRLRVAKIKPLAEEDRHEHYLAPTSGEKKYGGFNLEVCLWFCYWGRMGLLRSTLMNLCPHTGSSRVEEEEPQVRGKGVADAA